jgi:hypothetical protein
VFTSTETSKEDKAGFDGSKFIAPFKPFKVPGVLMPKFFIVNFTSLFSSTGLYCCAFTKIS